MYLELFFKFFGYWTLKLVKNQIFQNRKIFFVKALNQKKLSLVQLIANEQKSNKIFLVILFFHELIKAKICVKKFLYE